MNYKEKIKELLDNANEKQLERLWYFIKECLT